MGQPEIDAEMKMHYLMFITEDSIVKLSDKVLAKPVMIKASEKTPVAIWKCKEDGQCFETMEDLEDHEYFLRYKESDVRYFGKKGNILEDEKFDFEEREYGVYAGSERDLEIIESLGNTFCTLVPWDAYGSAERKTGYFVYDEKEDVWFNGNRIERLYKLLKKIKESSGSDVRKH